MFVLLIHKAFILPVKLLRFFFSIHYSVNPPAYTSYLIWKELFTLVVTSCMHTEVVFSVQEEFFFRILRFCTSFTRPPALSTCSTQVKLPNFRVWSSKNGYCVHKSQNSSLPGLQHRLKDLLGILVLQNRKADEGEHSFSLHKWFNAGR